MLKTCSVCKKEKPLEEFNKDKTKPQGLEYRCKKCAVLKNQRYRQTRKGKLTYTKYNRSKKGKATQQRYLRANRELGRQRAAQIRQDCPERALAMRAVNKAIRQGLLPKADTVNCEYKGSSCNGIAKDYHHYRGYNEKHWLDVWAVCRFCHREIDKKQWH